MIHSQGWIGVDLDGTLAVYDTGDGIETIGAPILPMVNRVKKWLLEGRNVKIVTARVAPQKDDGFALEQRIYDS